MCKKGTLQCNIYVSMSIKSKSHVVILSGQITSSTSSGINIVSIFEYASDTCEVSALLPLGPEPLEPSSQAGEFLGAFILARSSFANSRAWTKERRINSKFTNFES
jgi:hypothetical protein